MKRSVWKWTLWIALIALILLILFEVGIWALGNATGAMLGGIMGRLDPENFGFHYLAFDDFLLNSVGSPMFYCFSADLIVLLCSVVIMILTKKNTNAPSVAQEEVLL